MAKKLATLLYEVSPVETLTVRVSGPFDPIASLDGTRLGIKAGKAFPVTPRMLNGSGSHHFLFFTLIFPPGDPLARYKFVFSDATSDLDTITKSLPDDGTDTSKVEVEIVVEVI